MRFATQKRVLLEVELIRICTAAGSRRQTTEPVQRTAAPAEMPERRVPERKASESVQEKAPEKLPTEAPSALPKEKGPSGIHPADQELLSQIREQWDSLCRELSPANRAVFMGTILVSEQPASVTVVFRNNMNYKIAATNREENGLRRLSELVRERLGLTASFFARPAKPGEFDEDSRRVTDEDLLRIHFPVDIE